MDDPPATPVASNPQRVIKWLKHHVREPLDTYFAYEDASVQDIKACARAAGFTGNTAQSPLLTYMTIKSRLQGFALKLAARSIRDEAYAASDSLGTLHFSHWVPFEHNHLGFFTIFDGDFEQVHPGLRRQDLVRLRLPSSRMSKARRPPQWQRTPQAFYEWALENNHPPIGFYSAYPGPRGPRHPSPARRSHGRVAADTRVADTWQYRVDAARRSSMSEHGNEGPGALRRLLERGMNPGGRGRFAGSDEPALDLADIQGFVLRGYRMPMVRHFLLTVGAPAQARRQLGRLVSGDESDVPQITTAEDWHVGFAPGPGDDPADAPRRTPDYCLNIGITWPGLVALEIEERVPTLSFKSFGAFVEGAAQRAELVGDTGAKLARELDRRVRKRGRSRPGDAARHQPGGDDELQRQVVCLVRRGRCLSRDLAPGRDGVDGDARRPTRADGQGSLRIHRRHHDAHHSRRPGELSARSPGALRAVALRLAGRR